MVSRGLFLVTGLPATGKTTLARALARALAVPLLAKDAVKEPLLEILGAADRRRPGASATRASPPCSRWRMRSWRRWARW